MKKLFEYLKYVGIYGGFFFSMAIFTALISVFLIGRGFDAVAVSGVVSAAYILAIPIQPVIGILQDKGNGKRITAVLLAVCGVMGVLFARQSNFIGYVACYAIVYALMDAAMPYIEKIATINPYPYRYIRIWGTIGYGLGVQMGGLIYENVSAVGSYYVYAVVVILTAAVILGTADPEQSEKKVKIGKQEYQREIIKNINLWKYLIIAALFYAATNLNNTYLPVFYQQNGLSVSKVSTVLFFCTLMELPAIFFSSMYMNRFTNEQLLKAEFIILVIQFAMYAFMPDVRVKIVVTILLKAVTTMVYIMVNLKVVSAIVASSYQMCALALVAALSKNFVSFLLQNVGGSIFDQFSGTGFYIFLLGMSLAGLILVKIFKIPSCEKNVVTF